MHKFEAWSSESDVNTSWKLNTFGVVANKLSAYIFGNK
jgi:hypothetical protein